MIRQKLGFAVLILAAAAGCGSKREAAAPGPATPQTVAAPVCEDRDALSLRPWRGKVVAVALGRKGCAHSTELYRQLDETARRDSQDTVFAAVLAGFGVADAPDIFGPTPALHIIGDPSGKITEGLPTQVTPTVILYGKWGEPRYTGAFEAPAFKTMCDKLAAESKPEPANHFLVKGPKTGETLPDFTLESTEGESLALAQALQGAKALVFAFTGTGCDSSKKAHDGLSNMAVVYADDGAKVLAIHVGEASDALKEEYAGYGLPFPVLLDPGRRVADRCGVEGVPTVFVADGTGRIVMRTLWHEERIEQEVKILLGLMKAEERQEFPDAGSG